MQRRTLTFDSCEDVIAEIERLEQGGYEQLGQWSLGQNCAHLSYWLRGSLEGYSFRMPWIIRKLFGPWMLRKVLREMDKPGRPTIPKSRPGPDIDEQQAIDEAKTLLRRLGERTEPLEPSPMFDGMPDEQARRLHLLHAAHHLSFLQPPSDPPFGMGEEGMTYVLGRVATCRRSVRVTAPSERRHESG